MIKTLSSLVYRDFTQPAQGFTPVYTSLSQQSKAVIAKAMALGADVLEVKFLRDSDEPLDLSNIQDLLQNCPNLKVLDLSEMNLSAEKVQMMCELVKGTQVTDISLQYNHQITPDHLKEFCKIPELKKIDLQKCPRIPSLDTTHPIQDRPDLEILTGGFLGYEE